MQMPRKATTTSPCIVFQSGYLLLACDKPIFELPIQERMNLHSHELETWARLVTLTVKRTLADAAQYLRETNHTITAFIAPARPKMNST